jgi:hypothetical protein
MYSALSLFKKLKSYFSNVGAGIKQGQQSLQQMATILQERGNIAATQEQQITTQIMQVINAFAHCWQSIDTNVGGGH